MAHPLASTQHRKYVAIGSVLVLLAAAASAQTNRPATSRPPASAAAAASAPGEPAAPDRAELDRTQITGSRELPKVLYIVPWKQPPGAPPIARPERSVIDDALAPVERQVLQRQIGYHRQLVAPPPGSATTLRP
jgi:hypothetical protein